MYKFNYTVVSSDYTFATDLPTRELARNELREVKALGYKDAKIIREEFLLINSKQVR
jgi:hypothetical protein